MSDADPVEMYSPDDGPEQSGEDPLDGAPFPWVGTAPIAIRSDPVVVDAALSVPHTRRPWIVPAL